MAAAMVVAGITVLNAPLARSKVGFLIYWLACLLFTLLAAGTAVLDVVRVRAEIREAQRALLEETLRAVEREKQERERKRD